LPKKQIERKGYFSRALYTPPPQLNRPKGLMTTTPSYWGVKNRIIFFFFFVPQKKKKKTNHPPSSIGRALERHPFSGLVDSAGELLHTP